MKRILPLIFLIVFEAIADIFATKWSQGQFFWYAVLALLFYLICNTFWLFALKNGSGLGRGSLIFSIASAGLALGIGMFVFKEHFTAINMAGIVLGLVSIILLSL